MRGRRELLLVAAITLGAALLRFPTLASQSLWFDESFTIVQLRQPLGDFLSRIDTFQATPPFYYLLAWPWERVFGEGAAAMRSLSALFGTATVPVMYLAGRTLFSRAAGALAAAFVAASPALVWYSQEARPYALLVLLCVVALLFFARTLRGDRRGDLAGFALASALAVATHYFAAFLVAPAALLLLWRRRDRAALVALGVVVAAGLAVLPLALAQRAEGRGWYIDDTPVGDRVLEIARQLVSGITLAPGPVLGALGAALMAAGASMVLLLARGRQREGGLLALGLLACALGLPVLMGLVGENFLLLRNVLSAWAPLALAVAAGFAARRAGKAGLAAGATLAAVLATITLSVASDPDRHRSDWRALSRLLDEHSVARAIVAQPGWSADAIRIYRDGTFNLGAYRPVRVSEIVLLGPETADPAAVRSARGPISRVKLAGASVRVVRAERLRDLKLVVLALDRPRPLSPRDLSRPGLAASPGGVSFELPR